MNEVNPITGEVEDVETVPGTDVSLVPLNLAGLDEDAVLAMFPSPAQAAGALLYARAVARKAPAALNEYRTNLKKAEKDLAIALALGAENLLSIYPRMPMTERRDLARAIDDKVKAAEEARDTAWLLLEYARDYDRAIGRDIDILRSLNANFRGEHR
jgi:hypothetical protein